VVGVADYEVEFVHVDGAADYLIHEGSVRSMQPSHGQFGNIVDLVAEFSYNVLEFGFLNDPDVYVLVCFVEEFDEKVLKDV